MTMEYHKVWEVMNDLESAFNNIVTIESLVGYAQAEMEEGNIENVKGALDCLKSYLPVYTDLYDKASKRAWNNTVLACKTGDKYHGTEYTGPDWSGSVDIYGGSDMINTPNPQFTDLS